MWQTLETSTLASTSEVLHKGSSPTLPQPQVKKQLHPQRRLRQNQMTCPSTLIWLLPTTVTSRYCLILDLHLVPSPSPFISLLLSIYWIRRPYCRMTFSRIQYHFQYNDVWYCRPPYRIPPVPRKYLKTIQGVRHHTSSLPDSTKYRVRGRFLGIHGWKLWEDERWDV